MAPEDAPETGHARRRRWVNIVVIVAAAYALAAATHASPPESVEGLSRDLVAAQGWLWAAYALGGILGFAAVFSSVRWPRLGRPLALAAGLVVLSGFLTVETFTPLTVLSIGATGVALLAAGAFMGPMPSPQEEAREEPGTRGGDPPGT